MHTREVLIALLTVPGAVVITSVILATCVLAVYSAADVQKRRNLPEDVTARVIPRWSARVWWSAWRSKKQRKKCALALIGAGSRIVAAAFAWFLGTTTLVVLGLNIGRLAGGQRTSVSGPPLIAFAGAVWGGALVLHAIRYTTDAKVSRVWSSPELWSLVEPVGLVNRFDFLRKVWLYTWLRWSARAGGYLGFFITMLFLTASPAPAPAPQAHPPEFTAEDGYAALWLASLGIAFVAVALLRRAVAGAMPAVHAAVAVQRFLAAENSGEAFERPKRRAGIIDRLGKRRVLLARAARALNAAGARIDLAFGQQPVASILRGCSRRVQGFLAGSESLAGRCPTEIKTVLEDIVAVLAGPADPRFPAVVAQAVEAFDQDGSPVQQAAPKGHWISLAAQAADAVDRYSRLAAALWGLFSLAAVIFFLFRGGIDLSKIQLQK